MEKSTINSICPICYDYFRMKNLICIFEDCLHEICQDCFDCLKSYSDKCPLCGLFYKKTFKKDISQINDIIGSYALTEDDYRKIKKNKTEILGIWL